ncbi:MAG: hypothetical protein J6M14_05570 [Campylobacter sp.]|nr:hypothetical protein [Campylobacter sp.]
MKKILIPNLVAMGFVCGYADEGPRSYEYFAANLQIAKARVQECAKTGSVAYIDAVECNNASNAVSEANEKIMAKLPRERVEILNGLRRISVLLDDFYAYHTAMGKFENQAEQMTNIPNPIAVAGKNCAKYATIGSHEVEIAIDKNDEICKGLASEFEKNFGQNSAFSRKENSEKSDIWTFDVTKKSSNFYYIFLNAVE